MDIFLKLRKFIKNKLNKLANFQDGRREYIRIFAHYLLNNKYHILNQNLRISADIAEY